MISELVKLTFCKLLMDYDHSCDYSELKEVFYPGYTIRLLNHTLSFVSFSKTDKKPIFRISGSLNLSINQLWEEVPPRIEIGDNDWYINEIEEFHILEDFIKKSDWKTETIDSHNIVSPIDDISKIRYDVNRYLDALDVLLELHRKYPKDETIDDMIGILRDECCQLFGGDYME